MRGGHGVKPHARHAAAVHTWPAGPFGSLTFRPGPYLEVAVPNRSPIRFRPLPAGQVLRRRSSLRHERLQAGRVLRHELISFAGLLGATVRNQAGQDVGHLLDVVARVHTDESYPPVTGLVLRVGHRRSYLDAAAIAHVSHQSVTLRTARMDLRDFTRRPGEVLLGRDILDHQLVDTDGVQVIRAADLYLAFIAGQVRLVGVDVSLATLARRLGPKRWRGRPTPERVIDWDAIEPFGEDLTETPSAVRLRAPHAALHRLRPAELADLLEDLGRPGRQELLASMHPSIAADALEEMEADELTALLREAEPEQAAALVAAMEPDEAVDALRDLSEQERDELIEQMPERTGRRLTELLGYSEDSAGGFMTTTLARAQPAETIASVAARLAERTEHRSEIDAVTVVDDQGRLLADVSLFDLFTANPTVTLGELLDQRGEEVLTAVNPDANIDEVAQQLIRSRSSSVLVIDEEDRPIGRILADDILDAIQASESRIHFPRLLS
jgi:CBS domain-containing protein